MKQLRRLLKLNLDTKLNCFVCLISQVVSPRQTYSIAPKVLSQAKMLSTLWGFCEFGFLCWVFVVGFFPLSLLLLPTQLVSVLQGVRQKSGRINWTSSQYNKSKRVTATDWKLELKIFLSILKVNLWDKSNFANKNPLMSHFNRLNAAHSGRSFHSHVGFGFA